MLTKRSKTGRPSECRVAFMEAMEDRRLYSVSQSAEPPPEPTPQEPVVVASFLSGIGKAIGGVIKQVAPVVLK